MNRWTVRYEVIVRVNVEATSIDEAVTAAERTLGAVGITHLRIHEITHCSDVQIDEIKDSPAGVEISN